MHLKTWLIGTALLAASTTPFAADKPLAHGPLDGKTFAAVVSDGKKADPDKLIFKDGTFRSTTCDQYGFTPVTYTAVQLGDTTTFEAVATSPKSGTMHWKGKVTGKEIEGTAEWDPGWWRPNRDYTFKGKRK
jgi:hypothetical protein